MDSLPDQIEIALGNPYEPPTDDSPQHPQLPTERVAKTRSELAGPLALSGCLGGAALGTIGFVLLIATIELLLTPPFKSPPNYGQFSIVVIGVGFYLSIFGVTLAFVPYTNWLGYIPIHILGLSIIWLIDREFFIEVPWTEAPMAAMILLLLMPTPVAVMAHAWVRRQRFPHNEG